MHPDDEAVIRELAAQIGEPIPQVEDLNVFAANTGYQINQDGRVSHLGIYKKTLTELTPITRLTALTHLGLHQIGLDDPKPLAVMTGLTHLGWSGHNTKDLSPLQPLSALTQLYLQNNQIQDLSPLQPLSALTQLDLQNNQIQDLSPLQPLSALTHLYLDANQIQDLSPLQPLSALTLLSLSNNQIQDLSPLQPLSALTLLSLSNNQIQDLSPLQPLSALTHLFLSQNQIQDLSPLQPLSALTLLSLSHNQIQDLSPLQPLSALTILDLQNNQIQDLSPLQPLSALTLLYLQNNQIQDLSPLQPLSALTHLYLDANQIQDLSPLQPLSALTLLYLQNNQIQDLSPLQPLSALTHLYLDANQIQDLSPLQPLSALTRLYLHNNQIQDLSPLQPLSALTHLYLDANQIQDLSPLQPLSALTHLYLQNNQIQDLSPLQPLSALTHLYLQNNQIQDLSPLQPLSALTDLYLHNNQIQDLSPLQPLVPGFERVELQPNFLPGLYLGGNPLTNPPPEIVEQGKEAVLAWFDAQAEPQYPLNEVKVLLVGAGGAGKTSLVKAIKGESHDPAEPQTHGIRIEHRPFSQDDGEIRVRFWDFGGQEIMHATHQFFMSQRSLYVLVLDGRKEHQTEEYWLKHIESFGGDSPILVVMNKIDENPGYDVDRRALQRKYPGIVGFHRLSCEKRQGIDSFLAALCTAMARVPMVTSTWPQSWFLVKTELEQLKQPFIEYDEYRDIYCAKHQVTATNQQETLIQYLSDLGVALHFPDLAWLNTQVLNPQWITNAVYTIINHPGLAENKGIFSLNQLATVLPDFPKNRYPFLIALMKKFELCFTLKNDNEILVPDLLPVGEPDLPDLPAEALHFAVKYHFLPRSIIARLIVKRHTDIVDQLAWRTGVVLQHPSFDARAVVRVDYEARRLQVEVTGAQRRDYFAVILSTLREIHDDFEKIDPNELLRCTCSTCRVSAHPHLFDYNTLLGFLGNQTSTIACYKSFQEVPIEEILSGTLGKALRSQEDVYAAVDELRGELIKAENSEDLAKKIISSKISIAGFSVDMVALGKYIKSKFKKD